MSTSSAVAIVGRKNTRVYLYKHSDGPAILKSVLVGLRSDRTNDGDYLARIIFDAMTANAMHAETGYGISATEPGISLSLIVINPFAGTVELESDCKSERTPAVPFADFVTAVEGSFDAMLTLPIDATDEQRGDYYTFFPLIRAIRKTAKRALTTV